ncbi:MAG TPA: ferrochelatase [Burkholderiaceae bacterium]|nr:ferrochelatase [Burkholderiaceae bacterium]
MPYSPEPVFKHGSASRTAVLLVNLGTPESSDAGSVRRFLREFLSDPRVVEIPRVIWWLILYGLVLPLRPRKTAAKYAAIWSEEGSPLMVYSRQQASLLRGYLGERGFDVEVALAMRYGEPSIASALGDLRQKNVDRLLVLPMYPQYSATTTASVFDAVANHVKSIRNVPEMRWVKHFHDHSGYIEALKRSVLDHWAKFGALGQGDKLVISFHGVPKRTLELGDPYHCECQKTGRLLATSLGLGAGDFIVTFQSRFGRAAWLQPYTAPTLRRLAADGCSRVDVICPGFATDCLETLEEIAIEAKSDFLLSGGKQFHYIACLNGAPAFIAALADLVQQQLQGWPVPSTLKSEMAARDVQAQKSRERARLMGASD